MVVARKGKIPGLRRPGPMQQPRITSIPARMSSLTIPPIIESLEVLPYSENERRIRTEFIQTPIGTRVSQVRVPLHPELDAPRVIERAPPF